MSDASSVNYLYYTTINSLAQRAAQLKNDKFEVETESIYYKKDAWVYLVNNDSYLPQKVKSPRT